MHTPTRWTVTRAEDQSPLLEYLAGRLRISRKQAKRLLDVRAVFVNRQRVWMARHRLRHGDQVEAQAAPAPRPEQQVARPIHILRETGTWLVADKPAGWLSNGPGSLESRLRQQRNEPALEAVHRIDRDTSGCLLLARTPAAREALVDLFETRSIRKAYVALVEGAFPEDLRQWKQPLEGLPAVTDFRLLAARSRASLVEARPLTGRTHQIRLHLRATGHPLAGDRHYATGEKEDALLRALPRQMLHAWRLEWSDPESGPVSVEAPWPDDFRRAARSFGLRDGPPVKPGGGR